jgi:DNA-binding GntR family transcriptional regulator
VYENLIPALATATRIACLRLTAQNLKTIGDHVEQSTRLPRGFDWERKAVAHAEVFSLLADAVDDLAAAAVLRLGADLSCEFAIAAGPAVDGVISSSNLRLLDHLRAGDADAAEQEIGKHFECLHNMWRLTCRTKQTGQQSDPVDDPSAPHLWLLDCPRPNVPGPRRAGPW